MGTSLCSPFRAVGLFLFLFLCGCSAFITLYLVGLFSFRGIERTGTAYHIEQGSVSRLFLQKARE